MKNNKKMAYLKAQGKLKIAWVILLYSVILIVLPFVSATTTINLTTPINNSQISNPATLNCTANSDTPLFTNLTIFVSNVSVVSFFSPLISSDAYQTHGVELGQSAGMTTEKYGMGIIPLDNVTLLNVTVDCPNSNIVIIYDTTFTMLVNSTIINNNASFTYNLTKGNQYYIKVGNLILGDWTLHYNDTVTPLFPKLSSHINWTGGVDQSNVNHLDRAYAVTALTLDYLTSNPIDSINATYTSNFTAGQTFWNCLACDTLNSCNYGATSNFHIPLIINSQTYRNSTYESAVENFVLNFTYDKTIYQIASASLIYNSTIYSSTISDYGSYGLASSSVNIPYISTALENKTFYWSVRLTNSTDTYVQNTSALNQSITAITFGNCNATNNYTALNITAFDQSNQTQITGWNFLATIGYSGGISSPNQKYVSFNNQSITERKFCINVNGTIYLNGVIEYSATNYLTSTYYLVNLSVSNTSTVLKLGLLNSTLSTNYIIQVVNQYNIPLPGYFIKINRCYADNTSSCTTVQSIKTDNNGQGIAFLESYTVLYQFQVYDPNNTLVYTSSTGKIAPQTSPYTITLTVGSNLPNPLNYLGNITGLTYNLAYDKNLQIITLSYTDTNASFISAGIVIYALNASGSDSVIINISKATSTDVIVINMSGNSTGTYSAQFYLIRSSYNYFVDNLLFEIETFSSIAGMMGIFGGFIIILICAFIFAYNEVAGIIAINLGVIFVNFIVLVNFGLVTITAIIGISIIMVVVLERG